MHKKVAIIGSVGSGKTTMVEQLSNIEPLNTDVLATEQIGKDLTTVGIDYGWLKVNDDITLGLYGVPGQKKFSLVWDFVKQGLWAVIILVKNNDPNSYQQIPHLLQYFGITEHTPCVIGITHADQGCDQQTLTTIRKTLEPYQLNIPTYTIDPRTQSSVQLIMQTLISIGEESQ